MVLRRYLNVLSVKPVRQDCAHNSTSESQGREQSFVLKTGQNDAGEYEVKRPIMNFIRYLG